MIGSIEHVPPRLVKRLFSGAVWEGTPESGTAALTFDDGPDPDITPSVLDSLGEAGARATFFLSGERTAAHPETARAITDSGHAVGNHSMTHRRMLFMSGRDLGREIDDAAHAIADATGSQPVLFRPPYGVFSLAAVRAVRERGMSMVLWTVLAGDYSDDPVDMLLARVKPFIRPGAIIVFHDTLSGGGRLLPGLIRDIASIARERDVKLGCIDDLMCSGEVVMGDTI